MDHPGAISGEGELVKNGKDLLRGYHDLIATSVGMLAPPATVSFVILPSF